MIKIYHSETCPICLRAAGSPFRVYDSNGKIIAGCVDHFHTGHLVTPSASSSWHGRPEAKKIRASMKDARMGCVTERTELRNGMEAP